MTSYMTSYTPNGWYQPPVLPTPEPADHEPNTTPEYWLNALGDYRICQQTRHSKVDADDDILPDRPVNPDNHTDTHITAIEYDDYDNSYLVATDCGCEWWILAQHMHHIRLHVI